MIQPQAAIVPEPNPFALYVLIKATGDKNKVLKALQQVAEWVGDINSNQPGANLATSVAFSHQFWASSLNEELPSELIPFPVLECNDKVAPTTEADILLHCHSTRHDLHFFLLRKLMLEISEDAVIVDETYSYRYLDSRDMTGFIDGTENPAGAADRTEVALVADGPFAGGSYVMVQRFEHSLPAWNALSVKQQEKIIGRTKEDSIELDDVAAHSHVGRVDIKEEGKGLKIVRHSLPYGTVSAEHGLLFIAYCHTLHNFTAMLESMYGQVDGETDQLLEYTKAVTGAYFFAPSDNMLKSLAIV
ncbi:deferrochelatase [Vibrio sp. UCD-FRSSP16_10]|uniref:Dyp-type peroxidase n=1 Tax=unclassified Vibrio TaxID=2614977 RepID=UPI0007FCA06E|nr:MULTISPECIES: Dyp-type peroxidase [unclassified Vibrio]OBT08628.1 deferrochelatase [Vibrio sp. UCD-FRSSP16_30]OBT18158.1 deferrochelatase [Vibrio sp. UCD-FRSSP16_10]